MRLAWWVLLVVGVAPSGCSSGQTGSAECVTPISCACELFVGQVVARARFVEVDVANGVGTVELDEVRNPVVLGANPPPGFRVSGPFAAFALQRAKAVGGCEDARSAPPVVDQPVLVTFSRSEYDKLGCENCPEACDPGCLGTSDPPPLAAELWTLPWADAYDFGGTVVLSTEVSSLTSFFQCSQRFPAMVAPCDDTVTYEQGPFGCSTAVSRRPSSGWGGLVALALAAALLRRRVYRSTE
jgi:MYXO-CTERM domain-containing protein